MIAIEASHPRSGGGWSRRELLQVAGIFGKIAALGLATNNLAVKLLFKPNSATDFWPGKDLSGVYPMWLRQIAKAVQSTGSCLKVTGHTSRSGTEQLNDRLSLARAETARATRCTLFTAASTLVVMTERFSSRMDSDLS